MLFHERTHASTSYTIIYSKKKICIHLHISPLGPLDQVDFARSSQLCQNKSQSDLFHSQELYLWLLHWVQSTVNEKVPDKTHIICPDSIRATSGQTQLVSYNKSMSACPMCHTCNIFYPSTLSVLYNKDVYPTSSIVWSTTFPFNILKSH